MIDLRIQTRGRVSVGLPWAVHRSLAARVRRAVQRLTLQHREVRVSIDIVDDPIMTELHARHMGESKTTDVLAFPDLEGPRGSGDIALNWDAVRRQAVGSDETALLDEATSLCVHAVTHLFGHDHKDRAGARRMLQAERRAARAWGLVLRRPYAPETGHG